MRWTGTTCPTLKNRELAGGIAHPNIETLHQKPYKVTGHLGIHYEADDVAAPAPLQCSLKGADEIHRFFINLHLGITEDAKHACNMAEEEDRGCGEQALYRAGSSPRTFAEEVKTRE
jgi:hypothetical protein